MNKKDMSEEDIKTIYIDPSLKTVGWDFSRQIRKERFFTDGRIYVKGEKYDRGERKKADYILYYKPNLPLAIIEAKGNKHSIGSGLQQGIEYAEILDIPFVYSSNGDGFIEHDRTGIADEPEKELTLEKFPSPMDLWNRYKKWKRIYKKE